jgi:hypothetical protein
VSAPEPTRIIVTHPNLDARRLVTPAQARVLAKSGWTESTDATQASARPARRRARNTPADQADPTKAPEASPETSEED